MKEGRFDLSLVYGYGETVARNVKWSPDLDLHSLIRCIGGTIHHIDYADFRRYRDVFEDSIYVRSDKDFDLILPAYATSAENRYTIAHELGHYVLHSHEGMCYARRNGSTPIEIEADCFAMGFLMPSDYFRKAMQKFATSQELSIFFLVPIEAVEKRKKSLGL